MLRNRSRVVTKQPPIMPDHQPDPTRSISSFLPSPRFFNGFFLPKNGSSPTSILDTNKQLRDSVDNPFRFAKNPEKPTKVFDRIKHPSENFDSEGIALALVLIEQNPNSQICKPNLFGSKLKIQIPLLDPISPNGSPESPGDFGIKTRNSVFSGAPTPTGSGSGRFVSTGPLSLSEMELSEEYTRVISHGPNPKTTHIYDNCVVKSCCGIRVGSGPPLEGGGGVVSFCHTCKKNLGEGSDIFMYRGEIGFCSEECRCQQMVLDGLMNS
ncbi:hypothetical protein OSB04_022704 [Centaurea solstitialis]|uniref:FLZ-type domain-containing protein n=1 Tax=Centaurea solstitialis TaxID=347529 RepID=A0AA38T1A9_9ASTR|nr:hypothetical protein OSB04_022704 [Centaurea solstitialis]